MPSIKQGFERQWDTLSEPLDLPSTPVANLSLRMRHSAATLPWEHLRGRLSKRFGQPVRERKGWGHVDLEFGGRLPALVRIGRRDITVRGHTRIRTKSLAGLLEDLKTVPGAGRTKMNGSVERFGTIELPAVDG